MASTKSMKTKRSANKDRSVRVSPECHRVVSVLASLTDETIRDVIDRIFLPQAREELRKAAATVAKRPAAASERRPLRAWGSGPTSRRLGRSSPRSR